MRRSKVEPFEAGTLFPAISRLTLNMVVSWVLNKFLQTEGDWSLGFELHGLRQAAIAFGLIGDE